MTSGDDDQQRLADRPRQPTTPRDRPEWQRVVRDVVLDPGAFVRLTIHYGRQSDPTAWQRLVVRPVQLKRGRRLQFSSFDATRDTTQNYRAEQAAGRLDEALDLPFKSLTLEAAQEDLTVERTGKGTYRLRRRPAPGAEREPDLAHDAAKRPPLPPGRPDPYLQRLGIVDEHGQVRMGMHAKFAQINQFLKLLEHTNTLEQLEHRPMTIVDCGCGSAALTFAVAHYLHDVRGIPVRVEGVDRNAELVAKSARLAATLGGDTCITSGAIISYLPTQPVDIVLALHACDTATDEAIAQAIRWGAPLILCVPCCHHHLHRQLQPVAPFRPVFRSGILKARLADILTDTFRALTLRMHGYATDVVEFIASEHTDRNVMLRAVRQPGPPDPGSAQEYAGLKAFWQVTPYLETLLGEDVSSASGLTR